MAQTYANTYYPWSIWLELDLGSETKRLPALLPGEDVRRGHSRHSVAEAGGPGMAWMLGGSGSPTSADGYEKVAAPKFSVGVLCSMWD